MAASESIPDPLVLISDYDCAFKRAGQSVYPYTQQQICLWHVMKNVVYNVKKKWNGPLEGSLLGEVGNGTSNSIRDDTIRDDDIAESDENTAISLLEQSNH